MNCPACNGMNTKESSFLNPRSLKCIYTECKDCGLEFSTPHQLKINALVKKNHDLEQKISNALKFKSIEYLK